MEDERRAPPITAQPHVEWYHGSPQRLTHVLEGSTVTPVLDLARAFSHKPHHLSAQVREDTETGVRRVRITHDGTRPGYLHRVVVEDPARDLRQHPGSRGAPGEEMLATRELPVEFIEELPLRQEYVYTESLR